MYKVFFSSLDLKGFTGYRYIFDNYLDNQPEDFEIKTIKTTNSFIKDYLPEWLIYIIISFILWVFLPIVLTVFPFIYFYKKKNNSLKNIFVTRTTNLFVIKELILTNSKHFYCVDSVADYYFLRINNFFLKYIIFLLGIIFEIYPVLFSNCIFYFNSKLSSDKFYSRYKFFGFKKSRSKYLLICPKKNTVKLDKSHEDKLTFDIAFFSNFEYFESKKGAEIFFDAIKKNKFFKGELSLNLNVFGKGSEIFLERFDGKIFGNFKINIFGFLDNLESQLKNTDLAIIPVKETCGLKIKILETISLGIPLMTTQAVAAHLPTTKNQSLLFVSPEIDSMVEDIIEFDFSKTNFFNYNYPYSWNKHFEFYKKT